MNNNSAYYDLALRIEDNFAEIESDITVNFREMMMNMLLCFKRFLH